MLRFLSAAFQRTGGGMRPVLRTAMAIRAFRRAGNGNSSNPEPVAHDFLNLDLAFEYEVCRAGEGDVGEGFFAGLFEADG